MIGVDQLAAIAARHGLPVPARLPEPWVGATSHVYPLGELVLKVPFDRADAIAALHTDAAVAPVARVLGVAAPELVALDASGGIVPVPYALFRRVPRAVPLDRAGRTERDRATWEAVGRQLALVHAVTDPADVPVALRRFRQSPEVDPRPWVAALRDAGQLAPDDARWLAALLDRLAALAPEEPAPVLCHGDVNAANVLVDASDGVFRALIDWAGAGWLDPAWDFAGVPLEVVPWLLAGHRQVAPLPDDASAEARVLWCQLQTRLHGALAAPETAVARLDLDAVRQFARALDPG